MPLYEKLMTFLANLYAPYCEIVVAFGQRESWSAQGDDNAWDPGTDLHSGNNIFADLSARISISVEAKT